MLDKALYAMLSLKNKTKQNQNAKIPLLLLHF